MDIITLTSTVEEGRDLAPLVVPEPDPIFGEYISIYTRAQAIDDGVLADVSELAKEAGFIVPVAITAGVHALIEAIPPSKDYQDYTGRLWDVLWMAYLKIKMSKGSGDVLYYRLILHSGRRTYQTLKIHSGPGDYGEHVITIMLPDED